MTDMDNAILGVCVVDFHHKRGPEVEYWEGLDAVGISDSHLWPNLPFQALPDGSHSFKETFTYFTLLYDKKNKCSPKNAELALDTTATTDNSIKEEPEYTTVFAISCSRQIRSDELIAKDKDVTRSTVQKAIVVVSLEPIFGQIKDKLSIVTNAFFLQKDFSDRQIIKSLYESLNAIYVGNPTGQPSAMGGNSTPVLNISASDTAATATANFSTKESQLYVGLCLRRVLHSFNRNVLVLLKALLLEKKIIFYGNNVESLCNVQFGLISLIPNLISHLQTSGSPLLSTSFENVTVADSFKSSDRFSVLKFLGFPLHIFEKGGLFSPYTPLQQVDDIQSKETKFFMVGTSNKLLAEQKNELCDILVEVDNHTVEILNKDLNGPLQLSNQDVKWMDSICDIVKMTWNENDAETPKNSQFEGSEDFIRWQFEDYLVGLLSSVKLYDFIEFHKNNPAAMKSLPEEFVQNVPINLFNINWVKKWKETQNFHIFNNMTDDRLFDLFQPKHLCNEKDAFSEFQQKLTATFQNLRRTNNNNTLSANSSQTKLGDNVSNKSVTSFNDTKSSGSRSGSNSKEPPKIWATWKDYFQNISKKNKGKQSNTVKATQDLKNSESTNKAIGTALANLGLKPSALTSDIENSGTKIPMEQTRVETGDEKQDEDDADSIVSAIGNYEEGSEEDEEEEFVFAETSPDKNAGEKINEQDSS
ncbi:Avl9p [Nakaseomyces bracarensis]|uniref:Avl9p n=1 Tax=Nakaseomyces bracarensis TaxID=273131 RepID=UPI0038718C28